MFNDAATTTIDEVIDNVATAATEEGLNVVPLDPDDAIDIATKVVEEAPKWSFDTKSALIGAGIVIGVKLIVNHGPKAVKFISGLFKKKTPEVDDDIFFDDEDDVPDVEDELDTVEIVTDAEGNLVAQPKAKTEEQTAETPTSGNRAQRRQQHKK